MKKGFTLIELLAVIVILAIIATIAAPIVLSIIEETKESATLRSAENYLKAVDESITKRSVDLGGYYGPKVCKIQESGDLLCDGTDVLEVEVKGTTPNSGTITFEEEKISDVSLLLDNKVILTNEKGELVFSKEETKESATLISAKHYMDAVEFSIAKKKLENKTFEPETCDIDEGNLLCDDEVLIEVELNKRRPISGGINYKNEKVLEFELIYDTAVVRQDSSGNMIEKEFTINEPDNIVYFDVSKGKVCSEKAYNVENSKTGYNGLNGTGNQNSCLKFYKFSDNDDGTVNLILDHNTTAVNEWYDGSTNEQGPTATLLQLKEDTKNWNGTIEPGSTVTVNGDTIDYTGFKARLISALEIAQIVDYSSWDGAKLTHNGNNGNWYYFATKTTSTPDTCRTGNSSGCVYNWLYDRTSLTCKTRGCLNNSDVETFGFWTDTSVPSKVTTTVYESCDGYIAFGVSHNGRVGHTCVNNKEHYGIRPVITVNL